MAKPPKVDVISPKKFLELRKAATPTFRVVPVDATWYMPNVPKDGQEQFLNEDRIPGAAFFNLDKVADLNSKYPHMLPKYDTLNRELNNLGLNRTDKLVVYDKSGIFSSPRVAWNLILGGHKQVYLLDNYVDYKQKDLPIDTEKITVNATDEVEVSLEYDMIEETAYDENYQKNVIEYEELLELVASGKLGEQYYTFDARSNDRFTGEAPEPRPGLSSGHIPSALNLPFTKVLNEKGNFKSKKELLELFKNEFDLDLSNPLDKDIIVMCGTGVTAVILRVAIESIAGLKSTRIRVYDGSWTEWAQRAPTEYIAKDV